MGDGDDIARVPELLLQRLKIGFGKHRRSQAANAPRIDIVQACRRRIAFRDQPVGNSLAHHGPLLARNGLHVRVGIGVERAAERGIEPVALYPGGVRGRNPPQLDAAHLQIAADSGRFVQKRRTRIVVVGNRSAVHGKRIADQRTAEQETFDMRHREDAADLGAAARDEKECAMPEDLLNDAPPSGKMEERPVRAAQNIGVPRAFVAWCQNFDARARRQTRHGDPSCGANTRSILSHCRSASRRATRDCIFPRLV